MSIISRMQRISTIPRLHPSWSLCVIHHLPLTIHLRQFYKVFTLSNNCPTAADLQIHLTSIWLSESNPYKIFHICTPINKPPNNMVYIEYSCTYPSNRVVVECHSHRSTRLSVSTDSWRRTLRDGSYYYYRDVEQHIRVSCGYAREVRVHHYDYTSYRWWSRLLVQ